MDDNLEGEKSFENFMLIFWLRNLCIKFCIYPLYTNADVKVYINKPMLYMQDHTTFLHPPFNITNTSCYVGKLTKITRKVQGTWRIWYCNSDHYLQVLTLCWKILCHVFSDINRTSVLHRILHLAMTFLIIIKISICNKNCIYITNYF